MAEPKRPRDGPKERVLKDGFRLAPPPNSAQNNQNFHAAPERSH